MSTARVIRLRFELLSLERDEYIRRVAEKRSVRGQAECERKEAGWRDSLGNLSLLQEATAVGETKWQTLRALLLDNYY